MRRRLLTLCSALSLLLCVAVCVLWVRSYGRADRVSRVVNRDRHTVRSDGGRLTLFSPPRSPPGPRPSPAPVEAPAPHGDGTADGASGPGPVGAGIHSAPPSPEPADGPAARVTNRQLEWQVERVVSGPRAGATGLLFSPIPTEEPTWDLWSPGDRYTAAEVAPPLLRALEDPDQFAAAHILLTRWFDPPNDGVLAAAGGGVLTHTLDGLRVELRLGELLRPEEVGDICYFGEDAEVERAYHRCSAAFDVAQLPGIRDRWHRRLDVAVGSVPWWAVFAATGALPAAWSAAAVRRRLRRRALQRRGLCHTCGYDLRATPGRCPECGTAVQSA